jgi:hypothetical protein
MTRQSSSLRAIYRTLFVCIAVVLPLTFYAAGFPTVGAALLLSGVMTVAFAVMRSRVLSSDWLAGETPGTINSATSYELAKALICAGLAIDVFFGGPSLLDHYRLWGHHISWTVVLTASGLLAIGAGLFLTRWFAGYLVTQR